MDVSAYLKRIDYRGPIIPSIDMLQQLHYAHLLAVPFENLSIHSNEPIVLHEDWLFDKIVRRHRGGFCYELNGLFCGLLRELGCDVSMLAAQVLNAKGELGAPFDHMTLLVKLEQPWLFDVGFGDSFLYPLRLDTTDGQVQQSKAYRIINQDQNLLMQQADEIDGTWRTQYQFTLESYQFSDYEAMCEFHQTSPESHFTKAPICSRATKEGRITLSDRRLISTVGSTREERLLADEIEYAAALRDHFGIVMSREFLKHRF